MTDDEDELSPVQVQAIDAFIELFLDALERHPEGIPDAVLDRMFREHLMWMSRHPDPDMRDLADWAATQSDAAGMIAARAMQ